jgi:hypothetical protein
MPVAKVGEKNICHGPYQKKAKKEHGKDKRMHDGLFGAHTFSLPCRYLRIRDPKER